MRWFFPFLLFCDVFGADGSGDGTDEAIQAWLNLAGTVAGDTYTINSGTFTVDTEISVTKAVTIKGQGKDSTILTDAVSSNQSVFEFTTTSPNIYRLESLQIVPDSPAVSGTRGMLHVTGNGQIAFGHLKFAAATEKRALWITNAACTGVVWDVEHYGNEMFCFIKHENWGGKTFGDGSWEAEVNWGSSEFLFFEDSIFNAAGNKAATDGDSGMRLVFRYNTVTDGVVTNHGTESGSPARGARALEVYENTFNVSTGSKSDPISLRSGTLVAHNNTATNYISGRMLLTSYRKHVDFNVFGSADGTFAWDKNDLTDGAGTPGGAGDGVFESGTATGGGTDTLTDSGKSWTTDEWVGYTLRQAEAFTSTSGGSNSVTVSGAGWTADEWVGFVITRDSDGRKSQVDTNTTDTLTLKGGVGNWPDITFSGSESFVLSRGTVITANTATELTLVGQGGFIQPDTNPNATSRRATGGNYLYFSGDDYEIRKVTAMWDQSGRGVSNAWAGTRPEHEDLGQHDNALDPCYEWNNTHNAGDMDIEPSLKDYTFTEDSDYYNDTQKPGYTPYTYPHPLRNEPAGSLSTTTLTVGP